jgi:pyruvate/2-oxoglutarate dehydrogenase complex dihydrolipoamide acyltransferase (E2) component
MKPAISYIIASTQRSGTHLLCTILRSTGIAGSLAKTPGAAAKLIGNRIVQSVSIDVGIAVEAEDGIMVPVKIQERAVSEE